MLQHTVINCNTLRHTATQCNTLQQHTVTHCNTPQHRFVTPHCTFVHRNTAACACMCKNPSKFIQSHLRCYCLKYVAVCCSALQCVALCVCMRQSLNDKNLPSAARTHTHVTHTHTHTHTMRIAITVHAELPAQLLPRRPTLPPTLPQTHAYTHARDTHTQYTHKHEGQIAIEMYAELPAQLLPRRLAPRHSHTRNKHKTKNVCVCVCVCYVCYPNHTHIRNAPMYTQGKSLSKFIQSYLHSYCPEDPHGP